MNSKKKRGIIKGKLNFYQEWLDQMPMGERIGWKGKWVRDRIRLLTEASMAVVDERVIEEVVMDGSAMVAAQ